MVDRKSRDELAEMLRQLCSGTLTIDEYESRVMQTSIVDSDDRAVKYILSTAETLYDTFSSPIFLRRFRGKYRLAKKVRREISTAIVFLHSDLEYEWPDDVGYPPSFDVLLLWLCGLLGSAGLIGLMIRPLLGVAALLGGAFVFHWSRKLAERSHHRWIDSQAMLGRDCSVWPFLRRDDYNTQAARPRLLSGSA